MLRSQKDNVRSAAQRLIDNNPVFLDTETTGLSQSDEVIDIAIVGFNGEIIMNSLVKPRIQIPYKATLVHGITNEMVETAPSWVDLAKELHHALEGKTVGIYNEEFDLRLLAQSMRRNNVEGLLPFNESFCIMKLFAEYFGQWDEYHQSYTWHKLDKAGNFLGVPLPNTHRALDDALLAREVFLKMSY